MQGYAKGRRAPDGGYGGYETLIAGDMEQLPVLKSALNRLLLQIKSAPASEQQAILDAYDAAPRLPTDRDQSGNLEKQPMGDLWGLTRELQKRVKDPGVLAAHGGAIEIPLGLPWLTPA